MIYADNAATTKLDLDAYNGMLPFLLDNYGNPSSLYSFSRSPKNAIHDARKLIADCINSEIDEIFFTSGGTESDNWAIKGVALNHQSIGSHIITSAIEHHAVLHSCKYLESLGFKITYLPVDRKGNIYLEEFKKAFTPQTILVSIILANNEIGTIQDIYNLSRITHEHNILFHSDVVQAVGHVPVDVKALGIDLLSASAHKFNGPKGVGFLYKRKGVELSNWSSGGPQEMGGRGGTENVAGIVGMAAALKKNIDKLSENTERLSHLSNVFLSKLYNLGIDYLLNGSSVRLPGLINISIRNTDGEMLLHRLDLKQIMVSTGSACNSNNIGPSHVIKAIGIPLEYANGTVRISLGKDNTEEEVLAIVFAIADIISR